MIKHVKIGLCLLIFPTILLAQKNTISGFIRDAKSGENLIGATVYDVKSGKGVVANAYGFYSLTLPSDSVDLRASFVGYNTQAFKLLLNKDVTLDIPLENGALLNEVVVSAEESIQALTQMSSVSVPIEQLKKVPMLMGETDVLKTLQLLPGIQGGNEGTSGIYVRGGGPDQNLILIDGVPVYNSSHLFGFFSIFNADAINNVTVVKGGFPARYNGRLSSVIDISMKEGNNQKIKGKGSIGLISSKLTLEGPIINEKTSFIVSARRTYIDILTRPLILAETDGDSYGGYFFQDLNFKVNHRFSDKDRVYLSFYGGKDKFYFRDKFEDSFNGIEETSETEGGIEWGNLVGALRWNHLFSPKLFGNVTATYSRYKFDVFSVFDVDYSDDTPDTHDEILYKSGIWDYTLKFDLDYLPHPDHNIKTGGMFINHTFQPGVFSYSFESIDDDEFNNGTLGATEIGANEFAVFVEDDFAIGSKLKINAGISTSLFNVRGENFTSIQPRLSARFMANKSLSIKASYAQMVQYIHLLTNGGLGLPTDLWVPATDQIGPQDSWQVALGAAQTLGEFEVSLESYYKEMDGLIDYKDGASFVNTSDDWESKVVSNGAGKSYGLELLIQRKVGRLSGWLGYTWSKTTRQFDELNFGKEFSYKYDRRHDVSLVGVFDINDNITVSGTWVYGTGNAISLPDSQFGLYSGDMNFYTGAADYYPERNNFRMRAYHRMDIGVTHNKQKRRGVRSWSYGAYNVYNRRNPFFMSTQQTEDSQSQEFVQYSLFPIIPYVTYSFEF